MNELNWKKLNGKKIHIILKNNYEYNGIVKSVSDSEPCLIEMTDKFGKEIIFSSSQINFIEIKEVRE